MVFVYLTCTIADEKGAVIHFINESGDVINPKDYNMRWTVFKVSSYLRNNFKLLRNKNRNSCK